MAERNTKSYTEYEILRILADNPKSTQRDIANQLNISLGKTNYLIHALVEKGLLKYDSFIRSDNKIGYMYLLTPLGIKEKSILARNFLKRKSEEYNRLKKEIEMLKNESW